VTFAELVGVSSEAGTPAGAPAAAGAEPSAAAPPPAVTLRRGLDGSTRTWAWHQQVLAGKPEARKTCTVAVQDDSGRSLLTYTLEQAWLSRLTHTVESAWRSRLDVAALPASASQVVVETVTITCDAITMQPG
jgi:phage tail-like protein